MLEFEDLDLAEQKRLVDTQVAAKNPHSNAGDPAQPTQPGSMSAGEEE